MGRRRATNKVKPRSTPRPQVHAKRQRSTPVHAAPGHLRNAPIIEAIIDLRVEFPPGVRLDQIATAQDRFREQYPDRSDHMGWTIAEQGEERRERRLDGYFFEARNRQRVVQVRLDGFSMHWMRPYETWEALRDEARARWDDLRSALAPVRVTKIGVRYINRIDVGAPPINVQEWLITAPEVSPALQRPVSDFFMQLRIPYPSETICVISETVEPKKDEQPTGLIFDIDVGRPVQLPVDTDELWARLGELRKIKNEVFFKSITPRTKRLCQ